LKRALTVITKAVFGIFLFAGLPLIGWGIFDLPGYFSNPARTAYIAIVVLMQIAIVLAFPDIGRQGTVGKTSVQRQRLAIVLLQVLSLAIVVLAPFSDRRGIGTFSSLDWLRYLGLGIFVVSFVIMNWAEIALGKYFSIQVTVQEDHRLLTNGVFAYIRNPRYLGIILNNIGISLIFRSWLALVLTVALTAVLIWRIHDEEALMSAEFGESWAAYRSHTWRLLPFIY
jgi:protein-S-isoprenylcysteine O-methyltransferase Ste14